MGYFAAEKYSYFCQCGENYSTDNAVIYKQIADCLKIHYTTFSKVVSKMGGG